MAFENLWQNTFVALKALAMDGDRDKCLEAGMDDYLSKPYTQDELFGLLMKWSQLRDNPVRSINELQDEYVVRRHEKRER
jgi:CheY-like chemotaxis protein